MRKVAKRIPASRARVLVLATSAGARPTADAAATCADYKTQADAQRAADTRDPDGDGVYCESLPCPCAGPAPTKPHPKKTCTKPKAVQRLVFRRSRFPNIRRHVIRAIHKGWPRVMVLNRPGADARRDRLLEGIPTRV
jgi:hypothetical protein